MGPTWAPEFCRPQMGPMLVPWTLLSKVLPCRAMLDTHQWRHEFRSWNADLFDGLKHVHLPIYLELLQHVTGSDHQAATLIAIPKSKFVLIKSRLNFNKPTDTRVMGATTIILMLCSHSLRWHAHNMHRIRRSFFALPVGHLYTGLRICQQDSRYCHRIVWVAWYSRSENG